MDEIILLFPQTIKCIEQRIDDLKNKFKVRGDQDPTGANSRLLDPDRVSMYEEIAELENIISRSRKRLPPKQIANVAVGHEVALGGASKANLKIHLCLELDVKYIDDNHKIKGERLVSAQSPLGELIIEAKVGDSLDFNEKNFKIMDIAVSTYLK
jgi:transcription elongation GreA/GreB family factor